MSKKEDIDENKKEDTDENKKETEIERLIRRVNHLAGYITNGTKTQKLKYAILQEYSKGNFFDIPKEFIEDKSFIINARKSFFESTAVKQRVPKGLFEGISDFEFSKLILHILNKVRNNINIEIDFEELSNLVNESEERKNSFKKFQDEFDSLMNVKENYEINKSAIDSILKIANIIGGKKFSVAELNSFFEMNNYQNEDFFDFSRKILKDNYYNQILKVLEPKYLKKFKDIEIEYTKSLDENLLAFLGRVNAYFKEDAVTTLDDEGSRENLEQQKNFLMRTVFDLDKMGGLKELIDNENDNIDLFNKIFSEANKIPKITKASILEEIDDLDMSKPQDVIRMILMNRAFTNKLAHNYEAFAITNIYMNTISDRELWERKNIEETSIQAEIEKVQSEVLQAFYKAQTKYREDAQSGKVNDFSFATEFFEVYRRCVSNKGDIALKKWIKDKTTKSENEIKNNIANKIKNQLKSDIKYEKMEYCVDVFENLRAIKRTFDKLRTSENGIVKRESFHEFALRVLKEGKYNKENDNFRIQSESQQENVEERMLNLIERLKKENVVRNLDNVISLATKRMELVNQLFATKHFFTIELANAAKKYPMYVALENDPSTNDRENGLVDVYFKDSLQVFGGHYKEYEIEATDYRIQLLPGVDKEINEAYGFKNPKTGDSYMATYIPIKPLNEKQKKEIEDVLSNLNDEQNLPKQEGGKDTKKTIALYKVMKARMKLALDTERFKEKTNELSSLEMKSVNQAMQELKSGTKLEELGTVYSPQIIKYIIKKLELDTKRVEAETGLSYLEILFVNQAIQELKSGTKLEELGTVYSPQIIKYIIKKLELDTKRVEAETGLPYLEMLFVNQAIQELKSGAKLEDLKSVFSLKIINYIEEKVINKSSTILLVDNSTIPNILEDGKVIQKDIFSEEATIVGLADGINNVKSAEDEELEQQ